MPDSEMTPVLYHRCLVCGRLAQILDYLCIYHRRQWDGVATPHMSSVTEAMMFYNRWFWSQPEVQARMLTRIAAECPTLR